jgi:hypothetical protein
MNRDDAVNVLRSIPRRTDLGLSERSALVAVAARCMDDPAGPDRYDLMRDARVGVDAMNSVIQSLKRRGFLIVDASQKRHRYRLNVEAIIGSS